MSKQPSPPASSSSSQVNTPSPLSQHSAESARSKNETIPLGIRSFGHDSVTIGGASARPKFAPGAAMRFTPKLKIKEDKKPKKELIGAGVSDELDVASSLVHSLALRKIQAGRSGDANLTRASTASAYSRQSGATGVSGPTGIAQQKIQQHLNSLRQGRKKQELSLLELSFVTGPNGNLIYNPVTLPYVAKNNNENNLQEEGTKTTVASKRPSARLIDEHNRRAANLFSQEQNNDESQRQWFLVQLPGMMPPFVESRIGNEKSSSSSNKQGVGSQQSSKFEELPEGRLGQLNIHRSGKVTLLINKFKFDVNQGSDCSFNQEVGILLGNNSELILLGNCEKRIVVTPHIA